MDVLVKLSKEKEIKDIYDELKKGFSTLPRYLRGLIVQSLRNIRELYYESNESMEKIRHWSEIYENNPVDKGIYPYG